MTAQRSMKIQFASLPLILSNLALLLAPPVLAQADSSLMVKAKREGQLVWYTSMNSAEAQPILDGFMSKYPFITADLLLASADRIINRVLHETRADNWNFDVVTVSGIEALAQRRLIARYKSPESQAYLPQFRDPDGRWNAVFNDYYVIGYNRNLLRAGEAPRDWKEFLDAKWKGKIAIAEKGYEWFAALQKAWGREKANGYMRALAKQNIQWCKSDMRVVQRMIAGESPVGIAFAQRIEEVKNKYQAPLEWVNTLDPVVVALNGVGISARPNDPATAKLFVDFILSKPVQELIRKRNRIPARSDVEPILPAKEMSAVKLQTVPRDLITRYDVYRAEFRKIFGL